MKKADAERLIVAEIRKMLPAVPYEGAMGGMLEYQKLLRERPELFEFKATGDKWQVVHGWLRKHHLVTR